MKSIASLHNPRHLAVFQAISSILKRLHQLSPLHETQISPQLSRTRIRGVLPSKLGETHKSFRVLLFNILYLFSGISFHGSRHTGKLQNL